MNPSFYCFLSLFFSFLLCTALLAFLIPRLRAMKMGQKILDIGPAWHAPKEGTPTMGGLAFLLTLLLLGGILYFIALQENTAQSLYPFAVALLYTAASGAIGIVDDLTKLLHRRNDGLTPTQKLLLQSVLSAAYLALLRLSGILDTRLHLPFFGIELELGFFAYFVLLLLLVGVSNCANLTDGIDGLAASVGGVIFAFFLLLSLKSDAISPLLLSSLLLGCALSFLLFNHHPARIFMGDTGSLLLGAGAAALPLMLRKPLLILICGTVYLAEGASVILQVLHYKRTHRRLFLMAPIHHHFEKRGWSENRIVGSFTLLTLLSCLLAWFVP